MNFTKTFLGALAALLSATALAAVDVNKATQAELESVKGIGTASSKRILDERSKAPFKDWSDMIDRVRGIGPGNAARYSTDGLTVNGSAFDGKSAADAGGAAATPARTATRSDTVATKPAASPATDPSVTQAGAPAAKSAAVGGKPVAQQPR